jgi:hypothetical protein
VAHAVVGAASTGAGTGLLLAAADGGVFAFGNARYLGSMAGHHLNAPIVGIAVDDPLGAIQMRIVLKN